MGAIIVVLILVYVFVGFRAEFRAARFLKDKQRLITKNTLAMPELFTEEGQSLRRRARLTWALGGVLLFASTWIVSLFNP